ncbi:MAG: 4Fe-4S binding protein [Acidobacteriota bacterium]
MGILSKPRRKRIWYQALAALGLNAWLPNWLTGQIYQGKVKGVCVPVLNCYSCPSALGACPIGALQTSLAGVRLNLAAAEAKFGLYVVGLLGAVGSVVGRMPCGWLCPFGLLQELAHKIPTPKLRLPRAFSYGRYVFLAVLVVGLPLLVVDQYGLGQTWFCKWVCPAGTLEAGIPLILLNKGLRGLIGFMYYWKVALLFLFLGWMTVSRRPFCRAVCPLGAILGLFNKASLFRMAVDGEKCTRCERCRKDCPVEIGIYESANSPDCVRCLKCLESCKYGAISYDFLAKHETCPDSRINPLRGNPRT